MVNSSSYRGLAPLHFAAISTPTALFVHIIMLLHLMSYKTIHGVMRYVLVWRHIMQICIQMMRIILRLT